MKLNLFIVIGLVSYIQIAQCRSTPTTKAPKTTTKRKVIPPLVKKAYLKCADETKVDPELVLQLRTGKWKENDQLKKWVQCVLVKNDLMTEQSVFQMDVALSMFNEPDTPAARKIYEKNIDKCLPTKALKPAEIAWQFAKCYHNVSRAYSLF